jgi:ADP-heptose:LPS heptosyltransferase
MERSLEIIETDMVLKGKYKDIEFTIIAENNKHYITISRTAEIDLPTDFTTKQKVEIIKKIFPVLKELTKNQFDDILHSFTVYHTQCNNIIQFEKNNLTKSVTRVKL